MAKHFLHLSDFSDKEIWDLLNLASDLKSKFYNKKTYSYFKNRSLAMIFAKPSARTRVSFETGFQWMGGSALFLGPNDIGIGKREAIKDISRLFSRYNDMIMARLFDHDHILELAEFSDIPVINGLTDYNHPCQILADIFTIWEHLKSIEGLKITYIGDGNNIVNSWLQLASVIPLNFVCCCPEGYKPDANTIKMVNDKGLSNFQLSQDPHSSDANSDVIYTDVWASMGQKEEAQERKKIFQSYQVNSELIKATGKKTLFMHCLPAERGHEVTDEVIESCLLYTSDAADE